MAIDVLRLPRSRPTRLAATFRSLTGPIGLGAVAGTSFAVRAIVALTWQWTPKFFPDEYIYGTLARSIAESGKLAIRGHGANFPAVLEPLLAAPFWLIDDPATAYRLTLVMHALAMSLAAVPVYLLARRLGIGERIALAAAALTVASPALMYANWLTADAVAYPLALGSIAVYVHVLARPGRTLQLVAVVLTALTLLARMQFVILPVVFVLGALVVERGSIPTVVRRFPIALGLFLAPALGVAVLGTSRVLGYYKGVVHSHVDVAGFAHWFGLDATLVGLTVCILAPGAVAGIAAGLARPRTRSEAAFAAVTTLFACGLLLEAALYASTGSERFQERYLIALAPLAAPAFALSLRRGARTRWVTGLVAAGLFLFALRVPLSGYVYGSGKQDSPFFLGVYRLEGLLGIGTAGLVVSLIAGAMCLGAIAVSLRSRPGVGLALSVALAASIAISIGAELGDRDDAARVRRTFLPTDASWVDHARLGAVDVLVPSETDRGIVSEHLFWNRSLDRVLLLPKAVAPDAFGSVHLRIGRDGTLLDHGRSIRRPLLVEDYASTATFVNAKRVRTTVNTSLWRPLGSARLSTLMLGRYFDGWLAARSSITIWPDASGRVAGTLRLGLFLPAGVADQTVDLRGPGFHRHVRVRTHGHVTLAIPVHADEKWTLQVRATSLRFLDDGRGVSVESLPPVFERGPLKPAAASADSKA